MEFIGFLFIVLIAVIVYPTAVLAFGPLILGGWHLLSGINIVNPQKKIPFILFIWLLLFIYRFNGINWIPETIRLLPEIICFYFITLIYSPTIKTAVIGLILSAISLILGQWMIVFLLFFHHVMAFIFWYQQEKQKAFIYGILSFSTFVIFYFLPISPTFERLYGMDLSLWGFSLLPMVQDSKLRDSLIQTYALTQMTHYFIWLRVLPRIHKPQLSKNMWGLGILLGFASIAVLAFKDYPTARVFYISLAAFHGFNELAFWATKKRLPAW